MSKTIETPDLGDFENVPIIEIYISEGDTVEEGDNILAIESDKATMEIPSPAGGTVLKLLVSVGDPISMGHPLIELDTGGTAEQPATSAEATKEKEEEPAQENSAPTETEKPGFDVPGVEGDMHAQLVVLGSGPGGYTAAFRAADLGLDVILIERYPTLGGVCLNVGCIPSKALLHVAKMIDESEEISEAGILFEHPKLDIAQTLKWKNNIVSQLTGGLAGLAKKRKVRVVQATGRFSTSNSISLDNGQTVTFNQAIIAAGSRPVELPGFPHDDARLIDSTGALELTDIPENLLIIGGGIIGLEMATVYHSLGSKIHIVEMMQDLMPGTDPDLVRPLLKRIKTRYANIWLETRVKGINAGKEGLEVSFEGKEAPDSMTFDKVLVCVGRTPNGKDINAESAGVNVDERGFIAADSQQRTNVGHIFAIGDIVGQPMLAHKAVHEGKVAAEVAAGMKSGFEARVIPSVAYTDPEVAWVGVTETEAKAGGLDYGKGVFPWAASGRSLALGRNEGVTKLLFDNQSNRIIGAGITGTNAGDLIAEAGLAIEMNADAEDIGLTIHAHPTLAETLGFAAEAFEGTITDLYMPKKK
ncbi:MAG: dihydrolipoyl dehydrogenase [Gammaproteobacteria bacterium]|nr:dihydrolipoyl dehydrogenase [Gammaproteobacteria bacterium]